MLKLKSGALRNKIFKFNLKLKDKLQQKNKARWGTKNRETDNLEGQRKRRKLSDPRSKKNNFKKSKRRNEKRIVELGRKKNEK